MDIYARKVFFKYKSPAGMGLSGFVIKVWCEALVRDTAPAGRWFYRPAPAGKTDFELDKSIVFRVVAIQGLPDGDREHILYMLDGLLQNVSTKLKSPAG